MNADRHPMGGPPRRRPAFRLGQRTRYALLVTVVICIAVVVPPLLIPRQDDRADAAQEIQATGAISTTPTTPPPFTRTPAARSTPTAKSTPTARSTPTTSSPTPTPRRPRIPSCASPRNSEITAVPACLIYASALGTGWQTSGSGTNVTPGRLVPDSDQIAIRIQRRVKDRDQPSTVTLLANSPVMISSASRLRLRVFGGRQYGTILRLSASPLAGRAGAKTVTLEVPPERWAAFVVHVGTLSPGRLRRIDLAIAAEQMPQAYEFYVDDLTLVK
jgi:hypothetical protein